MKFLLDTDHISILQRQSGAEYVALAARLALQQPGDFAFSVVSFHEQTLGCHTYLGRSRTSADIVHGYGMLGRLLRNFAVALTVPFDGAAAAALDSLKAQRVRLAAMDPADRRHRPFARAGITHVQHA